MTKKQKIRWNLAFASRLNAAGAARTADLKWMATHPYLMSDDLTNDSKARGFAVHYTGADYWN